MILGNGLHTVSINLSQIASTEGVDNVEIFDFNDSMHTLELDDILNPSQGSEIQKEIPSTEKTDDLVHPFKSYPSSTLNNIPNQEKMISNYTYHQKAENNYHYIDSISQIEDDQYYHNNNNYNSGLDFEFIKNNNQESLSKNIQPTQQNTINNNKSSNLYEQDIAGGSWIDSFNDNSGINWTLSDQVILNDGNVRINPVKIPNSDFEIGTLGTFPDKWIMEKAYEGSGIFIREAKLVNDRYYSRDRSVYCYAKALSDGTANSHSSLFNLTTSNYLDTKGADKVIVFASNLTVKHSNNWGWNSRIRIIFEDGFNKFSSQLFWNGQYSGGTFNNYTSKGVGKDGNIWYKYETKIPKYINKSHIKIKIKIGGACWTTVKNTFGRFSCNIDNIYLDGPQIESIVSVPIKKPESMNWDSIIINKTQKNNTLLNITLLNGSNNEIISKSPFYTNDGEYDISFIDPLKYPTIKLGATFIGNYTNSPLLHYWGVSWNASNAWRDSLFGGLKASSFNLTASDGEIWLNTSPADFYKYSKNPILKVGSGSRWDKNIVSTPVVVNNGSGYMMWYSGGGATHQIGLATSPDGIKWTKSSSNPVLKKGSSGSWDDEYVKPSCVIYTGEIYKMWYKGMNKKTTDWNTGYATSIDGISWKKHPNNPVIMIGKTSSNWDNHYSILDDIHFDGTKYIGWYTGLAQMVQNVKAPYQIGLVMSFDGINWTKYPSPVLQGPQGWYTGYNGMNVILKDQKYLGYYNYKPTGGSPDNIHHASSNDGINWIKYTNNPILDKGASGDWDDQNVAAPEVILIGKQYCMYYRSYDGSISQIGLAKSKFSTYGSINSSMIDLPKYKVFNQLIINKTESTGTFINVSIIDANTNKTIQNFNELRGNQINISALNLKGITSIRLIVNFSTNGYETPILYNWAVTWRPLPELNVTANGPYNSSEGSPVKMEADSRTFDYLLTFQYQWDIDNDGNFDTPWSTSPVFNYTWHDDYIGTVAVQMKDNFGRNVKNFASIMINNVAPNVNAGPDQTITEGETASFIGAFSDPGKLDTHSILWNFGEGNTNTVSLNTSNQYPQPGLFDVILSVRDDNGGIGVDNLTLTVLNILPIVDAGENITVNEGDWFRFNGSIQNPGNETLSYYWDFDITTDGPDPDNITDNDIDSLILNASHRYPNNNIYLAKLIAKDDDNSIVDDICIVNVSNVAPTVDLKILPVEVNISLRIAGEKWHDVELEIYEDNIEIANGSLTRNTGSPNDQMLKLTTLKVNLSRVYSAVIRYTPEDDPVNGKPNGANPCWLILQSSSGKEVRLHHTFNVKQSKSYIWDVNLTSKLIVNAVTFEAIVYDPGADDITIIWDFGNGGNIINLYQNQNKTYPVRVRDQVTYAFQNSGKFTIVLKVKDDNSIIILKINISI
jgi:predicted GH43/DUF377 family glycosyl hydrolase